METLLVHKSHINGGLFHTVIDDLKQNNVKVGLFFSGNFWKLFDFVGFVIILTDIHVLFLFSFRYNINFYRST